MKRSTAIHQKKRSSKRRLDFRVSAEFKRKWEMVSDEMGMKLTQFVITSLNEAADRFKEQKSRLIHLDLDEQKQFLNTLTNPPEPNSALIQGFKDHRHISNP